MDEKNNNQATAAGGGLGRQGAYPEYIVTGETLLRMNVEEMEYLVQDLIPRKILLTLAGSSDTGKSSWLRQLALGIVRGDGEFLGFELNPVHNRVLYVSTEDDSTAMAHLLHKKLADKVDPKDLGELLYIFDTENLLTKVTEILARNDVDLVVIDAFSDVFHGDVNTANQVRGFLHSYSQLIERYGCPIVFLHHVGKRTEGLLPSKSNLLGSQGFEAKMRMVIELRRDLINQDLRHMCIVKGNYLSDDYKNKSYVLHFKDMEFTYKGERLPFIELIEGNERDDELQELICKLKAEGLKGEQILKKVNEEGFDIKRTTVYKLIKNCKDEDDSDEAGFSEKPPEGTASGPSSWVRED